LATGAVALQLIDFLNETFPKNSQIYQASDLPARLAQSTTLDFSRSASTDAGENR
jgi:hypothetical protein